MQLTSILPAGGLIPLPRSTAKASLGLLLALGSSGMFTIAWVLLVHLETKCALAQWIDGNRDGSDWWFFKDHGGWVTLHIDIASMGGLASFSPHLESSVLYHSA